MADHKHGEMDITEQEKAFQGFIDFTIRMVVIILAVLIFMAVFNS
jgi:fumarate reductase subunit C